MMQEVDLDQKPKRAIVAAVQVPSVTDLEFNASLAELRQLAKTLGFEVVDTFTQKRAAIDKAAYLGTGKVEELKALLEEKSADLILLDHEVSPSQAFNLEKETGGRVMDRTMVILEIFHRHASSRIARAQVEIARLSYMAPRMREAAKAAGPKDRARSGTGGRSGGETNGEVDPGNDSDPIAAGPKERARRGTGGRIGGESHGELDRRKIRDRIAELQKELDGMKLGRNTQ